MTTASAGWRLRAGVGTLSLMARRDDRERDVRRLLDELCVKLGICLPPAENRRLRESPPAGVDTFTDAVLEAEGMGDMGHPGLRRQVREVIDLHMSGWIGVGDR